MESEFVYVLTHVPTNKKYVGRTVLSQILDTPMSEIIVVEGEAV